MHGIELLLKFQNLFLHFAQTFGTIMGKLHVNKVFVLMGKWQIGRITVALFSGAVSSHLTSDAFK